MTILTLALVVSTTAAFWSAPVFTRPTLPFGVRVPARHATEPVIIRVRRRYTRGVMVLGVLAVAAVMVASPAPEWVIVVLAAGYCALGYHAHRSVATAKRDGDWYAGTRQAVTTDTSLRTTPVRPQWSLLSPAVALLVLTAGIGAWRYGHLPATLPTPNGVIVDATRRSATTVGYAFATVTAQLLIIALVVILAVAIPRARPELDAAQPNSSAAGYRTYLTGVLRLLFVSATCATASLLVASLQVWEILAPIPLATVMSYVPLAAALLAWVWFTVRAGDAGHRLPTTESDAEESRHVQRDDDRYWHAAGMIYVNRNDPAILVHRRVGINWTLNLGNPISWAIFAAIGLVALLAGFGVIELPARGN